MSENVVFVFKVFSKLPDGEMQESDFQLEVSGKDWAISPHAAMHGAAYCIVDKLLERLGVYL